MFRHRLLPSFTFQLFNHFTFFSGPGLLFFVVFAFIAIDTSIDIDEYYIVEYLYGTYSDTDSLTSTQPQSDTIRPSSAWQSSCSFRRSSASLVVTGALLSNLTSFALGRASESNHCVTTVNYDACDCGHRVNARRDSERVYVGLHQRCGQGVGR